MSCFPVFPLTYFHEMRSEPLYLWEALPCIRLKCGSLVKPVKCKKLLPN